MVAALALQLLLAAFLIGIVGQGSGPDGGTIALMIGWFAIRALLRLVIYILIGAMILQAVLSWINPYSPLPPGQPVDAPTTRPDPSPCSVDLGHRPLAVDCHPASASVADGLVSDLVQGRQRWPRRAALHIQPGARKTELAGLHGDALKIRLAAP